MGDVRPSCVGTFRSFSGPSARTRPAGCNNSVHDVNGVNRELWKAEEAGMTEAEKPGDVLFGSSPIFMADLPFRWNFSLPHVSLRA